MLPERIVLNVGGERFLTFTSTLTNVAGTRFANLTHAAPEYDPDSGEFFFDRNPRLFPYILDYCRTGEVHFPHGFCGPLLRRELHFWSISDDALAPCCWKAYSDFDQEQETVALLQSRLYWDEEEPPSTAAPISPTSAWQEWKKCVLRFLENPHSSKPAKAWTYLYSIFVIASIALLCLHSDQDYRIPINDLTDLTTNSTTAYSSHQSNDTTHLPSLSEFTQSENQSFISLQRQVLTKTKIMKDSEVHGTEAKIQLMKGRLPNPHVMIADTVCTFYFAIELMVRFVVWPGTLNFFLHFFNMIDILSTLPWLVMMIGNLIKPHFWLQLGDYSLYVMLSIVCTLRAVRILKIVHHNRGMQIIYLTIKASSKEILLLLLLMLIGMVIFSTLIYFVEFSSENNFSSIPTGFWWSIVTMTTVGYGDVTPKTWMGYLVGSVCALFGVLLCGLIIPVIANNFTVYHEYFNARKRLKRALPPNSSAPRVIVY